MLHFFSHKGVQKECNKLQEVVRVKKRKKKDMQDKMVCFHLLQCLLLNSGVRGWEGYIILLSSSKSHFTPLHQIIFSIKRYRK